MKVWFPVIRGGSGADVFTRRLAEALQRRGITAEVTWYSTHYQFAPFLLQSIAPPPGTHIIHANSWSGFAFKRPGTPLVVTEHLNVLDPIYRPYKSFAQNFFHKNIIRKFEKASFRVASAVTAVSRYTAASLDLTPDAGPIHAIYNWLNTTTFIPLERRTMPGNRPFRLLFVGNPTRRKGADLLAPIMTELGSKFELGFTSGLRDLKIRHITQNMIPLGRMTEERELIKAYHECDALLFPSRFEGFGLPAIEAMACGKPVIATNTSSLPEVVEQGVTGFLCPPDNIGAFVTACRRLADNPEILREYGQAARHRVEELFSEDVIIPQYITLYEGLADGIGR